MVIEKQQHVGLCQAARKCTPVHLSINGEMLTILKKAKKPRRWKTEDLTASNLLQGHVWGHRPHVLFDRSSLLHARQGTSRQSADKPHVSPQFPADARSAWAGGCAINLGLFPTGRAPEPPRWNFTSALNQLFIINTRSRQSILGTEYSAYCSRLIHGNTLWLFFILTSPRKDASRSLNS